VAIKISLKGEQAKSHHIQLKIEIEVMKENDQLN
jgi:hypothetical protein